MVSQKITIAIVDDKKIFRTSLQEHLEYSGQIEVAFMSQNGVVFLDEMQNTPLSKQPQIVLMDIEMPVMDGIETVLIAKQIYPNVQFVMLSAFDDDEKIFNAIKAGASGFLLKDESIAQILKSLTDVLEVGTVPFSPLVARRTLEIIKNFEMTVNTTDTNYDTALSSRELAILEQLVEGLNYNQIANLLFISPHTVRKHISNIYKKLQVTNKTAAVKIALKKNWF